VVENSPDAAQHLTFNWTYEAVVIFVTRHETRFL
jgi:hypothetical protein